MTVEIISIGNEVLAGATVNTNASFLSQELLKQGFSVSRHTVLPDEEEALVKGMLEALSRANVVLCTGGLGPTCDDNTRQVVAKLYQSDFVYNEEVAQDIAKRFYPIDPCIRDQATLPSKAQVMPNRVGTAPGLLFSDEKGTMILMPGVPAEMKPMFLNEVLPYLVKQFLPQKRRYRSQLYFCQLREMTLDPLLRELQPAFPNIEFGIYPSEGLLSASLSVFAENSEHAKKQLAPAIEAIKKVFPDNIYEAPSGKIEEAVHRFLIEKKKTLALAESCTGGALASRLTMLPGASDYFLGSVTAYSNTVKTQVLHVDEKTLLEKGAVSEEAVAEMAKGVLELMHADYSIAISGIAGPAGGTPEKPVGTVCMAIYGKNFPLHVWTYKGRGERETVITRSVNEALSVFWLKVAK